MLNTKPYRVEIHRRDFSYVSHYFLDTLTLLDDYLSPDENTLAVPADEKVDKGMWIHIVRDTFNYFGVISSVRHDVATTTIGYKPFNAVFAYPVLFHTALQITSKANPQPSLETVISNLITDYWITNADKSQRIPGLSVDIVSNTPKWTFYIEPESDISDAAIVNFFEAIVRPAMEKHYVAVNAVPNFSAKRITVTIGRIGNLGSKAYAFEADLPNVIGKNVSVYTDDTVINKLIVYNADNYKDTMVFYKHPDGSFDLDNKNRLTPVIYDIETAQASEDMNFEIAAIDRAISRFVVDRDSNLIELTYLQNDSLTAKFATVYGRNVTIHSGEKQYTTVLTGIELDEDSIKYIFGVVRVDLTKTLKRRKYNG